MYKIFQNFFNFFNSIKYFQNFKDIFLFYFFLKFFLFFLFILCFLYFLKKYFYFNNQERIYNARIINKIYLGSSHYICTLCMYDKHFIIGVTPHYITLLHIISVKNCIS